MKAKPRKSQKQRVLGVIQNDAVEKFDDAAAGRLVSAPGLAASGTAARSILSVKKKKLKAKKRRLGAFGILKWKNVTPDNGIDLLLGSDEGGFMSLEEVDGAEYEAAISGQAFPADSPVEDLPVPEVSLAKKLGRKKSKSSSVAAEVGPEVGAPMKVKKGKKMESSGPALEVKLGEESGRSAVAVSVSRSEDCVMGEEGVKPPNKRERARMKWEERMKLQASQPMAAGPLVEQKKSEVPKRKKLNLKERLQLQREKKRLKELALQGESNRDSAMEALKINNICRENREQKRLKEVALEGEGNRDSAMEADRVSSFLTEEEMENEEVGEGVGVVTKDAGGGDADMVDGGEGDREDEELLMEKVEGWREMRLHPAIAKGIAELGFAEPTAIQRACIPAAAHQGKDVIGAAETGSGKTLAFGIPILQRLMEERDKDQRRAEKKAHRLGLPVEDFLPQKPEEEEPTEEGENGSSKNGVGGGGHLRALVITPTRELALQVCDHLKAVARFAGVRVVPIVGGMAQPKQQRLLRAKPEVVVGTPGRLWELMSQGETHLTQLEHISFFVLDEADRMVEKGHFQELQSIIDLLPATSRPQASIKPSSAADGEMPGEEEMDTGGVRVAKKKRQTLLFSATLALPPGFRKKMKKLSGRDLKQKGGDASLAALVERAHINPNAAIVDLTTSAVVAEKLEQSVIQCMEDEKDQYLYYLLRMHPTRTLVFCTAISAVRRVLSILRLLQLPVWGLHAQMQQRQRLKAMDKFKASEEGVLVATDVAARGLDISGVRSVIHYQLPHVAEMYVHRCGRTARATSDGCSVALVSPSERAQFAALCRTLSLPDGVAPFPVKEAYIASVRKRVLLALKLDEALHVQSQAKAATSWVRKNAEELDIEIDDESMPSISSRKRNRGEDEETAGEGGTAIGKREEARVRSLQQELQSLLLQPLEPKAFSHRYIAGKEMTPTLVKQLRELQEQRKKNGVKVKLTKGKGRTEVMPNTPLAPVPVPTKSRLTVIGQDMVEALHALREARKD